MYAELFQTWLATYGYVALFGSLVFGIVGLPIPDETLLTLAGYFVFKGRFHVVPTVLTAFCGSIGGISLSYGLGRWGGYRFLRKYGNTFRVTEERLQKIDVWYEKVGKWMLTLGYFIPGVRHLMAFVAGSSRMRYPIFAAYAYTGAVIWSLTFVALGYYLGDSWTEIRHHRLLLALIGGFIIIAILVFWSARSKQKNPISS